MGAMSKQTIEGRLNDVRQLLDNQDNSITMLLTLHSQISILLSLSSRFNAIYYRVNEMKVNIEDEIKRGVNSGKECIFNCI